MTAQSFPAVRRFLAAMSKRHPSIQPLAENVANPQQTLNELRRELWLIRGEFWMRKLLTYPQVIAAAKVESRLAFRKFLKPQEWTYRDVASAGIFGLQCYGAFCVGEVLGGRNVLGYDVKVNNNAGGGH